jgi:hypothetical protein
MRWTVAAVSARCWSLRPGSRSCRRASSASASCLIRACIAAMTGAAIAWVLPGGVRGSLGGDDRADLGDLDRYRPAGQAPAEGGDLDQRHAG